MRKNFGLTLIETVISISIFVVASIIIGSLFISHTKLYTIQESIGSLKIQKTLFAKHLREIGEEAVSVKDSYTIGGVPYTSSSSTVIFQLPAVNSGGDIITNIYDYVVFYLDGNNLYVETEANVLSNRKNIKQKVSNTAGKLIFRYNTAVPSSSNMVSGYLYLDSNTQTDQINVGVYLRNKE